MRTRGPADIQSPMSQQTAECFARHALPKERAQIFRSTHENARDGWAVDGIDVNYEDAFLYCDNCGKSIDPAYLSAEELEEVRGKER